MRTNQSVRAGGLLGALAACMVLGGAAQAQVATERPGSILVFPKVVRDAERDTIIHITNTGNMVNNLRCFYVTGNTCRCTDFEVSLTRQQPTHWRASTGRFVTLSDPFGSDGAGLDPGLIPPVPMDFEGALVCAEVNSDGMPVAQNKLKGEASILAL